MIAERYGDILRFDWPERGRLLRLLIEWGWNYFDRHRCPVPLMEDLGDGVKIRAGQELAVKWLEANGCQIV